MPANDQARAVERAAITVHRAAQVTYETWTTHLETDRAMNRMIHNAGAMFTALADGDPQKARAYYEAVCKGARDIPTGLELDGTNGGLS